MKVMESEQDFVENYRKIKKGEHYAENYALTFFDLKI